MVDTGIDELFKCHIRKNIFHKNTKSTHRSNTFCKALLSFCTETDTYLTHPLKRKQKLGWKKGASSYLNQKYIMDQMEECVMIYTMENLNIAGDWANSEFLNPLSQSNND